MVCAWGDQFWRKDCPLYDMTRIVYDLMTSVILGQDIDVSAQKNKNNTLVKRGRIRTHRPLQDKDPGQFI